MIYDIVSNPANMTVTVGSHVFSKPHLNVRTELDFGIKEIVCEGITLGPSNRDVKELHRFYCQHLGPKFNRRFQAANYWLWVGGRMTKRTGDMLRLTGKGWRWYNNDLVVQANQCLEYINEAEVDGLYHLIPAIVVFQAPPSSIRKLLGRATWKRIAHNSMTRNARLMRTAWITPDDDKYGDRFVRLLDFPSGVLNAVHGVEYENESIAARISPRKTPFAFQQTVHIVRDARRMLGNAFNPDWGLARITHEHDLAAREHRRKRFSDAPFADAWSYEAGGYAATLLTNALEIAVEGDTQHHCVSSYASMAASGDYAVLRIEGAERATAGYRKHNKGWRLDQVYAACNAPVTNACTAFANAAGAALGAQYVQQRAA